MNNEADDPGKLAPGELGPDERGPARRSRRDSLFLLTVLSAADGRDMGSARVRNLSATGLMADCETPVAVGDRVSMKLRGVGTVRGTVAWVRDDRIGVTFDREIDPQAARRPIAESDAIKHMPDYLRPTFPVNRR
ncbi:PilZ domain-containing protein [Sphingobium algorifonticola]|uniref:PilZ domain-containing protein n=1 Tax=Sphingobium algorifonticola TaxID=2008318 RepID=A0A437J6H3_9SPHN|nr:PilZ domain-containing protein [Sphingobium algorifonticola]RVT40778.1 PilZ domain-containing protein [Sphingobium algorifonticola]